MVELFANALVVIVFGSLSHFLCTLVPVWFFLHTKSGSDVRDFYLRRLEGARGFIGTNFHSFVVMSTLATGVWILMGHPGPEQSSKWVQVFILPASWIGQTIGLGILFFLAGIHLRWLRHRNVGE